MTSGQPLPDVFFETNLVLQGELMQSGKVMDITEAFDKYASPRLKELYAKYPETLNAFTKDGKLMALPVLKDGDGTDSIMWIRQDWLDKLKLQVPATLDELDKVMDAFVNQDPDGDGKKNTIGLSISLKNGLSSWMSEGSWIAGAYGSYLPLSWGKAEDGTLVYGGIQPSVKQAIGTLADWFKKGYLDPEASIIDEVKASESFVNGKSGILVGPSWAYGWPLADTLKNVPEADIQPIKLPAGPDGHVGRRGINPYEGVLFFNKDFKHMDAFFYYLDKLYDRAFEVKDSEFYYGYHEGYDYVLQDGKPAYGKDAIGGDYTPTHYFLTAQEPLIPFDGLDLLKKVMTEGYAPDANASPGELKAAAADKHNLKGRMLMKEQFDSRILNQFNSPPTKTMESKNELLNKMELETLSKIVYNREPIDYFDTFVENWKKSGGDQITAEVNEWYRTTGK
jgi:putative aldouronate transport system substrate-binding protein